MADGLAILGRSFEGLLGHIGIHGAGGLDAGGYVLAAAVLLGFCAAVRSATRMAFLRCSIPK
jgi:hypothetical protein